MKTFKWDESKRISNIGKHRIDFADIPVVFDGPMFTVPDVRMGYGEDRWIGIGFLGPAVVVVAFAERADDVIRIISARKATKHERQTFEKELRNRLGLSEN